MLSGSVSQPSKVTVGRNLAFLKTSLSNHILQFQKDFHGHLSTLVSDHILNVTEISHLLSMILIQIS
jgi:hypothetical protein